MKVVEMVLSGSITNQLVRQLQKHDIPAIGLSGSDNLLLQAKAQDMENLGLCRRDNSSQQGSIAKLLIGRQNSCYFTDRCRLDGADSYNINADTAAAAIAVAVQAKKLLFVTDVPGVHKRWRDTLRIRQTNRNSSTH